MLGSSRVTRRTSRPRFLRALRQMTGNFFSGAGLMEMSTQNQEDRYDSMSFMTRSHRFFPSLPHDRILRRRVLRRISNLVLIPLLSAIAAYAIVHQSAAPAFSPPRSARMTNPAPSAPVSSPAPNQATAVGYKLDAGPATVTEVPDIVLHDAKRNKDLHVRIFYPDAPGKYPVIVFSHGAGGSQNCCEALTRHWASHGYVSLQPTHNDSVTQRRNSGEENIRFPQALRDALKKPALWESRPLDISFVLDSLAELQKRVPALAGRMDTDHIGVGGHSMGAFTADAIAGALIDLPGRPTTSFADSRVKAVLLLSPQGPGEFGLTDHSWERISIPLMSMTGSLDSGAGKQGPEWKKIPFERSQPGDKYHLFIQGVNHGSFVKAQPLFPAQAAQAEAILGYTNSAALAFWDAYLKGDTAAKNYLQSDALANSSHGAAKLSRR